MATEKKQNKITLELPEEIAEGIYSNMAIVAHFNNEFILDFVRIVPNVPKAKVKSRIVLTPLHAKRLLKVLADNIKKYEANNGVITGKESQNLPPMTFNPPKAQA